MKNVIRTTNNYGPRINVECIYDQVCLSGTPAYVIHDYNTIYLCTDLLTGNNPVNPIVSNNCAKSVTRLSAAEYLLHEMVHLKVIANGTATHDFVYQLPECKKLKDETRQTKDGQVIAATNNTNNYVMMAWMAKHYKDYFDVKICPMNEMATIDPEHDELRKLQGANNESACDDLHWESMTAAETLSAGTPELKPVADSGAFSKEDLNHTYSNSTGDCNEEGSGSDSSSLLLNMQSLPNSSDILDEEP